MPETRKTISRFKVSPRGLMFGWWDSNYVSNERRFVILRRLAIQANTKFESFNDTSGINCRSVYPISLMRQDRNRFQRRFSTLIFNRPYFGQHDQVKAVLEKERVTLADFDTPRMWGIPVSDDWLDASKFRNAKLKFSPNNCHPDAVYVQDVLLGFGVSHGWVRPPHVSIVYGYRRDSSSWGITISKQRNGETVGQMLLRAKRALERICEPASHNQLERDRIYSRLLALFDGRNVDGRAHDDSEFRLFEFEKNDLDPADYHPYFWKYRVVNALSHVFASGREIKVSDDDMKKVFMELKNAINNGKRRISSKRRANA